jgi:hypothetical protein
LFILCVVLFILYVALFIAYWFVCHPLWYLKTYTLKYSKLEFCMLCSSGVLRGVLRCSSSPLNF